MVRSITITLCIMFVCISLTGQTTLRIIVEDYRDNTFPDLKQTLVEKLEDRAYIEIQESESLYTMLIQIVDIQFMNLGKNPGNAIHFSMVKSYKHLKLSSIELLNIPGIINDLDTSNTKILCSDLHLIESSNAAIYDYCDLIISKIYGCHWPKELPTLAYIEKQDPSFK